MAISETGNRKVVTLLPGTVQLPFLGTLIMEMLARTEWSNA
jgi:hypothetical protein